MAAFRDGARSLLGPYHLYRYISSFTVVAPSCLRFRLFHLQCKTWLQLFRTVKPSIPQQRDRFPAMHTSLTRGPRCGSLPSQLCGASGAKAIHICDPMTFSSMIPAFRSPGQLLLSCRYEVVIFPKVFRQYVAGSPCHTWWS